MTWELTVLAKRCFVLYVKLSSFLGIYIQVPLDVLFKPLDEVCARHTKRVVNNILVKIFIIKNILHL